MIGEPKKKQSFDDLLKSGSTNGEVKATGKNQTGTKSFDDLLSEDTAKPVEQPFTEAPAQGPNDQLSSASSTPLGTPLATSTVMPGPSGPVSPKVRKPLNPDDFASALDFGDKSIKSDATSVGRIWDNPLATSEAYGEQKKKDQERHLLQDRYDTEYSVLSPEGVTANLARAEQRKQQVLAQQEVLGAGVDRFNQAAQDLSIWEQKIKENSHTLDKESLQSEVAKFDEADKKLRREASLLELQSVFVAGVGERNEVDKNLLKKREYAIKAKVGNTAAGFVRALTDQVGSMAAGAVDFSSPATSNLTDQAIMDFLGVLPEGQKKLSENEFEDRVLPTVRNWLTSSTGIDRFVSKEYIDTKKEESLFHGGLYAVAEMIPSVALSMTGAGAPAMAGGFFLSSYDQLGQEMSDPIWDQVNPTEKEFMRVGISSVSAGLSTMGMQALAGKLPFVKNIWFNVAKKIAPGMSSGDIRLLIDGETKTWVANMSSKLIQGFGNEGFEEVLDFSQEEGFKAAYEKYKESEFGDKANDLFANVETMKEFANGALNSFIVGGIAGDIMGGSIAATSSIGARERLTRKEFSLFSSVLREGDLAKVFEVNAKASLDEGKIDQAEYDKFLRNIEVAKNAMDQIPRDMDIEPSRKAFELLLEKEKLSKLNKSLVGDKMNVIDEKLAALATSPTKDTGKEKPLEEKPLEVKPLEVKPLEVKPLEVKPLEVKPTEPTGNETKERSTLAETKEDGELHNTPEGSEVQNNAADIQGQSSVSNTKDVTSTEGGTDKSGPVNEVLQPPTQDQAPTDPSTEASSEVQTEEQPATPEYAGYYVKPKLTLDVADDPIALASAYMEEHTGANDESTLDDHIGSHISNNVDYQSFVDFDDVSNVTKDMERAWLRTKGGKPLDVLAQEISANFGGTVTEQGIVDYIKANPFGKRNVTERAKEFASRYEGITGKKMNSLVAKKILGDNVSKRGKNKGKKIKAKGTEWTKAEQEIVDYAASQNVELEEVFDEDIEDADKLTDEDFELMFGGGRLKTISQKTKERNERAREEEKQVQRGAEAQDAGDVRGGKSQGTETGKGEEVKSLADRVRGLKINKNIAGSFVIPGGPAVWNTAVEIVATSLDAGQSIADAVKAGLKHLRNTEWYKGLTKEQQAASETEFEESLSGLDDTQPTPQKPNNSNSGEGKKVKKTVTTERAYEGDFRKGVKKELQKLGLYREIESRVDARESAKKFIESVGVDTALEAVRNNDVPGGAAAYVWIEAIEAIDRQITKEKDTIALETLYEKQASLIDEMGEQALSKGRFNSALGDIYKTSDLGFHSEKKATEWELEFGEKPSTELLEKWKERDKEFAQLKEKLAEAEKRAEEAEETATIKAIQDSLDREEKRKKQGKYTRKSKVVADQFRRLKEKPMTFKDADGNDIVISQMGFDWNALVEIGAKAIEKTGEILDGIAAIAEELKKQEWFSKMTASNQAAIMKQIEDHYNVVTEEVIESGTLKVPKQMIREAVANGAKTIDQLVAVIKEELKEVFPNATDREIRDAITEYGKTVSMSMDDLSIEVRRLKRVGRLVSALEDVRNKIRPLKSGLQRDKLDAEERALNRELKEAMKDLPIDEDTRLGQLKTTLDAAKSRARNRIEDLNREIATRTKIKKSVTRLEHDAELDALIAEKERIQEQHDMIFGDKTLTEAERLSKLIDSTRRSIEEYEKRIKDNDLLPHRSRPVVETQELRDLRHRRDVVKLEYRKLQEEAGIIEKQRLDTAKERAKQKIEDLRRRIEEGDFSKKSSKPVVADNEITQLNAEKIRLKEKYDKEFHRYRLAARSTKEKIGDAAWEAWALTRALQATGEFSFVLIQGGVLTISNAWHKPRAVGRAFKAMFSAMHKAENFEKWLSNVKAQEWYPIAKEAKLAITETRGEVSAREELFFSEWIKVIWNAIGSPLLLKGKGAHEVWKGWNPMVKLERGAAAYLDTLRVERFLDGMYMLDKNKAAGEKVTKQDYRDVADVANTLTGRASLGKAEVVANGLAKIFFSPRLWASAIKTATPYGLYHFGKMTPTARKMAIQDMGRFVGTTMTFVAAAAIYFANDDDDETGVEMDPRSSDFLKIRMGDTRIDPWGGRVQQVVFMSRLIMGALSLAKEKPLNAYKNGKGKLYPLGLPFRSPTMTETAIRMATNKLAPSASFIAEASSTTLVKERGKLERQTSFGEKYEISEAFKEKLVPIYWSTVAELTEEDPGALEGFLLLYSFLGGGVQVYDTDKKKKKKGDGNETKWKTP